MVIVMVVVVVVVVVVLVVVLKVAMALCQFLARSSYQGQDNSFIYPVSAYYNWEALVTFPDFFFLCIF